MIYYIFSTGANVLLSKHEPLQGVVMQVSLPVPTFEMSREIVLGCGMRIASDDEPRLDTFVPKLIVFHQKGDGEHVNTDTMLERVAGKVCGGLRACQSMSKERGVMIPERWRSLKLIFPRTSLLTLDGSHQGVDYMYFDNVFGWFHNFLLIDTHPRTLLGLTWRVVGLD